MARVRRARAAGGDSFILAVDANQGYSVPDALRFAGWRRTSTSGGSRSRSVGPTIAETSRRSACGGHTRRCRPDRIFRRRVPRADGSRRHRRLQLRRLVVGRPDGLAASSSCASTFGVEMAHHEEPQVSAHLLGSQMHGTYVECFHPDRDPFWWNLIANRPELDGGRLPLPAGPGLGWTLDPAYIDRYRVDR